MPGHTVGGCRKSLRCGAHTGALRVYWSHAKFTHGEWRFTAAADDNV
jgi:hypothetical protein